MVAWMCIGAVIILYVNLCRNGQFIEDNESFFLWLSRGNTNTTEILHCNQITRIEKNKSETTIYYILMKAPELETETNLTKS